MSAPNPKHVEDQTITNLEDIADVVVTSPHNPAPLKWNGTAWINHVPSAALVAATDLPSALTELAAIKAALTAAGITL